MNASSFTIQSCLIASTRAAQASSPARRWPAWRQRPKSTGMASRRRAVEARGLLAATDQMSAEKPPGLKKRRRTSPRRSMANSRSGRRNRRRPSSSFWTNPTTSPRASSLIATPMVTSPMTREPSGLNAKCPRAAAQSLSCIWQRQGKTPVRERRRDARLEFLSFRQERREPRAVQGYSVFTISITVTLVRSGWRRRLTSAAAGSALQRRFPGQH